MTTKRFVLELEVKDDLYPKTTSETAWTPDHTAADQLHDMIGNLADDQLLPWIFSVDGVEPT